MGWCVPMMREKIGLFTVQRHLTVAMIRRECWVASPVRVGPVLTARLNKNRVRVLVLSRALTLLSKARDSRCIRSVVPHFNHQQIWLVHIAAYDVLSTSDEWLCPPTFWNINRTSTLRSFVGSFMCFEATSS